jgi:hypothetical protein
MDEDANGKLGPAEQVSRLYEDLEAKAATASEELVASSGFAALLARTAENAAALTKLSGDAMDLVLRNLRVAGRRDIVGLARQLARTEDKLERVLQEVEDLRDELKRAAAPADDVKRAAARPASARNDGRATRAPARRRKDSS